MNWIDLALALLVIVPAAAGILVGFDQRVIGLAAAMGFALHDHRAASSRLRPRVLETPVANFVVGATLAPMSRSTRIWSNRAMGMFGAVRYGCGPPIHDGLAEPSKS
jgi:hypothetical protein